MKILLKLHKSQPTVVTIDKRSLHIVGFKTGFNVHTFNEGIRLL